MNLPMGTRTTCESCGHPIEYVGPFWRHVGKQFRHPATPNSQFFQEQEGRVTSNQTIKTHADAMATLQREFDQLLAAKEKLEEILAVCQLPRNRELLLRGDPEAIGTLLNLIDGIAKQHAGK